MLSIIIILTFSIDIQQTYVWCTNIQNDNCHLKDQSVKILSDFG